MKNPLKKKAKSMTVDDLALVLKRQFESIDQRFESMDKKIDMRFDDLKSDFRDIRIRTTHIERDLSSLRTSSIHSEEFFDLESRVKLIESKLDIKSGR